MDIKNEQYKDTLIQAIITLTNDKNNKQIENYSQDLIDKAYFLIIMNKNSFVINDDILYYFNYGRKKK